MTALAIDTATESLGLCLECPGQRRTFVREAGLKHSEALLPAVRRLLEDAEIGPGDLELLVCCVGPGSFTGIRIGLATAKGLSLARGIPLIGIANLDALAYRFRDYGGVVVPVIAALRRHYYTAVYRQGERISDYLALTLEQAATLLRSHSKVLLTGQGAAAVYQTLGEDGGRPDSRQVLLDRGPGSTDPGALLELGKLQLAARGAPKAEPQPLYLRKSDAEITRSSG